MLNVQKCKYTQTSPYFINCDNKRSLIRYAQNSNVMKVCYNELGMCDQYIYSNNNNNNKCNLNTAIKLEAYTLSEYKIQIL